MQRLIAFPFVSKVSQVSGEKSRINLETGQDFDSCDLGGAEFLSSVANTFANQSHSDSSTAALQV